MCQWMNQVKFETDISLNYFSCILLWFCPYKLQAAYIEQLCSLTTLDILYLCGLWWTVAKLCRIHCDVHIKRSWTVANYHVGFVCAGFMLLPSAIIVDMLCYWCSQLIVHRRYHDLHIRYCVLSVDWSVSVLYGHCQHTGQCQCTGQCHWIDQCLCCTGQC